MDCSTRISATYTFVVMSILILIMGGLAIASNIDIPVVSWTDQPFRSDRNAAADSPAPVGIDEP